MIKFLSLAVLEVA